MIDAMKLAAADAGEHFDADAEAPWECIHIAAARTFVPAAPGDPVMRQFASLIDRSVVVTKTSAGADASGIAAGRAVSGVINKRALRRMRDSAIKPPAVWSDDDQAAYDTHVQHMTDCFVSFALPHGYTYTLVVPAGVVVPAGLAEQQWLERPQPGCAVLHALHALLQVPVLPRDAYWMVDLALSAQADRDVMPQHDPRMLLEVGARKHALVLNDSHLERLCRVMNKGGAELFLGSAPIGVRSVPWTYGQLLLQCATAMSLSTLDAASDARDAGQVILVTKHSVTLYEDLGGGQGIQYCPGTGASVVSASRIVPIAEHDAACAFWFALPTCSEASEERAAAVGLLRQVVLRACQRYVPQARLDAAPTDAVSARALLSKLDEPEPDAAAQRDFMGVCTLIRDDHDSQRDLYFVDALEPPHTSAASSQTAALVEVNWRKQPVSRVRCLRCKPTTKNRHFCCHAKVVRGCMGSSAGPVRVSVAVSPRHSAAPACSTSYRPRRVNMDHLQRVYDAAVAAARAGGDAVPQGSHDSLAHLAEALHLRPLAGGASAASAAGGAASPASAAGGAASPASAAVGSSRPRSRLRMAPDGSAVIKEFALQLRPSRQCLCASAAASADCRTCRTRCSCGGAWGEPRAVADVKTRIITFEGVFPATVYECQCSSCDNVLPYDGMEDDYFMLHNSLGIDEHVLLLFLRSYAVTGQTFHAWAAHLSAAAPDRPAIHRGTLLDIFKAYDRLLVPLDLPVCLRCGLRPWLLTMDGCNLGVPVSQQRERPSLDRPCVPSTRERLCCEEMTFVCGPTTKSVAGLLRRFASHTPGAWLSESELSTMRHQLRARVEGRPHWVHNRLQLLAPLVDACIGYAVIKEDKKEKTVYGSVSSARDFLMSVVCSCTIAAIHPHPHVTGPLLRRLAAAGASPSHDSDVANKLRYEYQALYALVSDSTLYGRIAADLHNLLNALADMSAAAVAKMAAQHARDAAAAAAGDTHDVHTAAADAACGAVYAKPFRRHRLTVEEPRMRAAVAGTVCEKAAPTTATHTEGIIAAVCMHGVAYGASNMFAGEGPSQIMTILQDRFEWLQCLMYDNACNMTRYGAGLDCGLPLLSGCVFIDRFHSGNHTTCSPTFRTGSKPHTVFRNVNTQVAEQLNNSMRKLQASITSASLPTATMLLRNFLTFHNLEIVERQLTLIAGAADPAVWVAPSPPDMPRVADVAATFLPRPDSVKDFMPGATRARAASTAPPRQRKRFDAPASRAASSATAVTATLKHVPLGGTSTAAAFAGAASVHVGPNAASRSMHPPQALYGVPMTAPLSAAPAGPAAAAAALAGSGGHPPPPPPHPGYYALPPPPHLLLAASPPGALAAPTGPAAAAAAAPAGAAGSSVAGVKRPQSQAEGLFKNACQPAARRSRGPTS